EKIVEDTNAYYCLECGKCTAICPISRIFDDYSPRFTVEMALEGLGQDLELDKTIWTCLTCNRCSERCPSTVKYPEFIRSVRAKARLAGNVGQCSFAGTLQLLMELMANPRLSQNRTDWIPKDAKISQKGEVLYFLGCLPYLDVIYSNIGANSLDIAKGALRIMNKAGISPVIKNDERCCGHDLLWTGDVEGFEKLAKLNIQYINGTNAKTVVTTCPECFRTLKKDYPEYVGKQDFEVVHISQFIEDLLEKGSLKLDDQKQDPLKITYHDSCRLGRHMGVYESPRNVLSKSPDIELIEMERNRESGICCGVSAWTNCKNHSKQMQIERMMEAKATGADVLMTSCPKCKIHLKCSVHNEIPVERGKVDIEVLDFTEIVATALGLGVGEDDK
ncbi:MAG: (Fe-S)-binding protein, partial [Thermoplasmata archaeon]